MDNPSIAFVFGLRCVPVAQDFGKRPDRGHRSAQFVADLAEERVFLHRECGQFFIGIAQGARGAVLFG